jgi:diacylglycerol kinase (ATP)
MIGVITNPYARGVVADPLLPGRLAQIGGRRARVVETRNPKELHEALISFLEDGVEVIAACGGDGTNLAVLTEMIQICGADELPRVAILRGGTVNTVAANLGIGGSPEDVLTRLVAWHSRGMKEPVVERPTLCVNGSCGFLFGAAMGARFFDVYYGGRFSGMAWAAFLAARVTASSLLGTPFARRLFDPVRATITVDGKLLPLQRWSLLVAATVENVGLQIRITYRAMERPGHFHLVASGLPAFELARQLHRTLLSRSLVGEPHFDLLARETVIEFERPEPYIMDGDLFRATRLVLRRGPAVRLCLP